MDFNLLTTEMENEVLNSRESAECFNNILIKHEAENETQHQNCAHPCSADELKSTVKSENCTASTVNHLVKTELVEFSNNESNKNSHQNQNYTSTFMLKKIIKTETNIVSFDVDIDPSFTCEKLDDNLSNHSDSKNDSNSDSDPECDPFGDVHCDPSFSQTRTPQSQDPGDSVTNSGLINSRKSNVRSSLTRPSFSKSNLSTARILKHNFRHKTPHSDNTLQCCLCLVTQGTGRELKTHLKICAASHRLGNRLCVLCNNLFSTSQCYKNHALNVHKISLSLQCQLCLQELNSESELSTHLEICAASQKHGNRFCVLCNKLFSTCYANKTHAITAHKIAVSIQCGLCLEELNSDSELKTHLEICPASHSDSHRFCVPCNKLLTTVKSFKQHAVRIHGIARSKRRTVKRR